MHNITLLFIRLRVAAGSGDFVVPYRSAPTDR